MTKTVTNTGLIRVEYHGQVWFDNPGHTEIVFQRLYIEHSYDFKTLSGESIRRLGRDGVRCDTQHDEDS